jgi:NADH-quinone oxidoreductase subunit M
MEILINWMIFLPALGALACLMAPNGEMAKKIALGTALVVMLFSLIVAGQYYTMAPYLNESVQYVTSVSWIKSINVEYRTGVDGLNLPLVLLTTIISVLVIIASWKIDKMTKGFMALFLILLTGMLGVFLSLDLFLFYVFFEIGLLPMYFLIGIWGGPNRRYAAIKFFLYTLAGSICLLVVMMGLYFFTPEINGGEATWIMAKAASDPGTALNSPQVRALFAPGGAHWTFAQWAFWLTLISFLIKLPGVPFHTWLPDAHVQAPTPISMILAGVLLKMGGYALMRITYPFFPDAAMSFWYFAASLGVLAIIYGAFCAMGQLKIGERDWKKLVAYSSVSHMGYVLLGIAVMTRTAWDGAYYQMIGHGISSAMMFFMVGVVYERSHHRNMDKFGGLWDRWPKFGFWSLICFFAGMGLPGLCGFIGEIMSLLGTFDAANSEALMAATGVSATTHMTIVFTLGIIAACGVVLTAGYILWMFQNVYMGKDRPEYDSYAPVERREYFIMGTLGFGALIFGVFPFLVFNLTDQTFTQIMVTLGMG